MAIVPHKYIQERAGFFVALDKGIADSVGTDHDTPVFAVTSIEAWWQQVGRRRYETGVPGTR